MERVLNLITSLDRGGAETMIMNYYRHMDHTKVQFDFLVNREQIGAYEDEINLWVVGSIVWALCTQANSTNTKKIFAISCTLTQSTESSIPIWKSVVISLFVSLKKRAYLSVSHMPITSIADSTLKPYSAIIFAFAYHPTQLTNSLVPLKPLYGYTGIMR